MTHARKVKPKSPHLVCPIHVAHTWPLFFADFGYSVRCYARDNSALRCFELTIQRFYADDVYCMRDSGLISDGIDDIHILVIHDRNVLNAFRTPNQFVIIELAWDAPSHVNIVKLQFYQMKELLVDHGCQEEWEVQHPEWEA